MVKCTMIMENNECFIISSYNGIKIYIREKDGYINVSKLCNEGGRDFHTLKRSKRFRSILQYYTENEGSAKLPTPIYELRNGFNTMQGQYITPDLIHFVAEWISIEYSFKVKHIMDAINKIGKAQLIEDNNNLNNILDELNMKYEALLTKNEQLIAERELNKELIYEEAVRSSNVKDRKLTIYRENNTIKMSADNKKSFKTFIVQYTFPASMNIRMQLKKEKLYNKLSDISNEEYINIKNYLDSLNPKSRVEGIDFI